MFVDATIQVCCYIIYCGNRPVDNQSFQTTRTDTRLNIYLYKSEKKNIKSKINARSELGDLNSSQQNCLWCYCREKDPIIIFLLVFHEHGMNKVNRTKHEN